MFLQKFKLSKTANGDLKPFLLPDHKKAQNNNIKG